MKHLIKDSDTIYGKLLVFFNIFYIIKHNNFIFISPMDCKIK